MRENRQQSIIDHLEEKGVRYQRIFEGEVIVIEVKGTNGKYRMILHVNEDIDILVIRVFSPVPVPEGAVNFVGELLHRVDLKMRVGHFSLDHDDGEWCFVLSCIIKEEFTSDFAEEMICLALAAIDRCFPSVNSVIFANTLPSEAAAMVNLSGRKDEA